MSKGNFCTESSVAHRGFRFFLINLNHFLFLIICIIVSATVVGSILSRINGLFLFLRSGNKAKEMNSAT